MVSVLATYLHRIDPFALQLWEDGGLRWYGLSYIAGLIVGYLLVRQIARSGRSPLSPALVADFVFTVALGMVIGGRLGYCIFYQPSLLIEFGGEFPFWGVLALNHGGMASHGGVLGILAACLIFARRKKISSLHLLDLCALNSGLGIFFGRIANFVNGELVGRPVHGDLAWAVKFPQDLVYAPVEVLESLKLTIDQVGPKLFDMNGSQWMAMVNKGGAYYDHAVHLLITGIQKHTASGDVLATAVEPLLVARHPSQIYQALGEGLSLFVILTLIWLKPRKPGVISACFLIGYAVFRIIGEQFREPDAHIASLEFAHWGVTRGQLLSSVMIVAGAIMLAVTARRDVPKIGGWIGPKPAESSK